MILCYLRYTISEKNNCILFFFYKNYILGIQLGLDPKLLADIMGSATGRCWSVDTYNPCPGVLPNVPSSNDYKVFFLSTNSAFVYRNEIVYESCILSFKNCTQAILINDLSL